MYRFLIRPVLFLFSPEWVHHLVVAKLKILCYIPGIHQLLSFFYTYKKVGLEREVAGLKFPNPVGLAAGFDKNATFFNQFSVFGFGFIEVGTATPVGQPGNPKPRSFRLPKDKALINRMGFNNDGAETIAQRLKNRKTSIIIGGNIGKNTATSNEEAIRDYEQAFDILYDHVDYIAVNVSCPNIGDLTDLQDKSVLRGILNRLLKLKASRGTKKPIFLKISPDLENTRIKEVVDLVMEVGLDGIIATNTSVSRNGLATGKERIKKIGKGGLSGRPINKRSTEVIRLIHEYTGGKLPVIGAGGIMTPGDAMEKMKAGASLVQVYTGFIYYGPALVRKINKLVRDEWKPESLRV